MKKITKIILLFGPPASGKYTIGKKVAEKTGYLFLHSHVFTKIASDLIGHGSLNDKRFYRLLGKLRQLAIRQNTGIAPGIIFTGVYMPGPGDRYIRRLLSIKRGLPIRYYFIRFKCAPKVLMNRVGNSDRKKFDRYKVTSRSKFRADLKKHDLLADLPVKSLIIDTGEVSIKQAAQQIIHYSKN